MQTIGDRLEEARKRKGISIREAAEATKIRGDYLHKFESSQFDIKLPEIYVRGFLRIYANYLKLPGDKIVNDYLALGLGEGGRPAGRGLNREIYGKMEISHSSASSVKEGGMAAAPSSTAAAMTPGGDAPAASAPRQPFQPRMPLGGLDRALLAKNGLWLGVGGVVLLALVIWGVVRLASGDDSSSATASATTATQTEEPVYIIALRPVQIVSVKARLDNRELAAPRSLVTGERYPVPNADMLINVSDRAAVQFEFKGNRYGTGNNTGPGVASLNFSAQR
ncbi:MAG: helix-turn-helix domain-containing protein [Opitutaceae bacterium]|jgi:transcriptional regulator with XRE-family HTH domain|nr:helix-turn-helix domain-containing protein [Opitutaceae bacterium]